MEPNLADQEIIRSYLLGQMSEESQRRRVEERLLTDDKFFKELEMIEDEIIDQYVSGQLSPDEIRLFEDRFLATPERRQKLRFAQALRRYVVTRNAEAPKRGFQRLAQWLLPVRLFFSSPLRLGASLLILLALGAGAWRIFFYQSDLSKGLMALKTAYREQRPNQSRISGFGYAPVADVRGNESKRVDYASRDRAERILLDAVQEHPGPASHHALGQLYLAEQKFEQAADQFEQALKADPDNAQIHSDLGAVLLEQGRIERSKGGSDNSIPILSKSLEHLDRALQLNPSLLEALFNRALYYQTMMLRHQAREDWQKYLEKDPSSPWADEARQNLKLLETQQSEASKNREQVLQEFIASYQLKDDERGWQIISRNREAVTGSLIFEELTGAYLKYASEGDARAAADTFQTLIYASKIDSEKGGDPYVSELARFYSALSLKQLPVLAEAHADLEQGFELYRQNKFNEAGKVFANATELFEKAGNKQEAILAEHWVSNCYYQTADTKRTLEISTRLAQHCQEHGYRWALALSLNLLGNAEADFNEYSKAVEYTQRALQLSEQISDDYGIQKNLVQLANEYRSLSNTRQSLLYLERALESAKDFWPGERQMWRNCIIIAMVLYSGEQYAAAAGFAKEALQIGLGETKDNSAIFLSYVYLGLIYGKLHNYDEALRDVQLGYDIGRSLSDVSAGQTIMAYSALQRGYLQRQSGDFQAALASYDEAIELYGNLGLGLENYNAHKGRLLCLIEQGNDTDAEKELQLVINLFEKYRAKILEERNRDSFFDAEQQTYDVAIEFQFARLRNEQEAFEYSEDSRARSLLDLLNHTASASIQRGDPDIVFSSASHPLKLAEIQKQMPDEAQILQYAMLNKKLIIWVITKTGFSTTEVPITLNELNDRVNSYLQSISTPNKKDAELNEKAINLYKILISPVEQQLSKDKQLCIVPDKALNLLPFSALISPKSGKYLINDYTVLYAPSSNIFIVCSETLRRRANRSGERLLSIGNPTFDRSVYPSLPELPAAERESKEIAKFYSSELALIGAKAQKEQVMREMRRSDVIHFASHYIVDEQNPMLSKLLLAKGSQTGSVEKENDAVLQNLDIYQMQLQRARLVVLSACRTGVEKYYRGEGMLGISRTFIAAGVPLVVGSQWPVDSSSTSELMISFHKYRKLENRPTAEALRRAQIDMLNSQDERYRHPYYWASFITIGGYSSL